MLPEIPKIEAPDVHDDTFGLLVVDYTNQSVYQDLTGTSLQTERVISRDVAKSFAAGIPHTQEISSDILVQTSHKDEESVEIELSAEELATFDISRALQTELTNLREELLGLSAGQVQMLDKYCEGIAPAILQAAKRKKAPKLPWNVWLSKQTSDPQLINFSQWHVSALEEQQRAPLIQAELDQQYIEYKEAIRWGVQDEGWLHPDALAAIEEADEVGAYIGDIFNTHMNDVRGYMPYDESEGIVIAGCENIRESILNDRKDVWLNVKEVTKHELNHAVLGELGGRWLNEAVTTHIAQVFDFGEFSILRPEERSYSSPSYIEERNLLADLLTTGAVEVPLSLLTRSYSQRYSISEQVAFYEKLGQAWGHYVDGDDFAEKGQKALEYLEDHILRLEASYDKDLNHRQREVRAANQARNDLLNRPGIIFAYSSGSAELTEEAA